MGFDFYPRSGRNNIARAKRKRSPGKGMKKNKAPKAPKEKFLSSLRRSGSRAVGPGAALTLGPGYIISSASRIKTKKI